MMDIKRKKQLTLINVWPRINKQGGFGDEQEYRDDCRAV